MLLIIVLLLEWRSHVFIAHCRHQLVPDDDLGSLYDLLIDDPPEIRRAIGALVYDHVIAQKFNSSQSRSSGPAGGSSSSVYSNNIKLTLYYWICR